MLKQVPLVLMVVHPDTNSNCPNLTQTLAGKTCRARKFNKSLGVNEHFAYPGITRQAPSYSAAIHTVHRGWLVTSELVGAAIGITTLTNNLSDLIIAAILGLWAVEGNETVTKPAFSESAGVESRPGGSSGLWTVWVDS